MNDVERGREAGGGPKQAAFVQQRERAGQLGVSGQNLVVARVELER
jgi:hypothetical protein